MREGEEQLPRKVSAWIAIDRDMVDLCERNAGGVKTIANRFAGEPGPMLDPAKPLLFGGSH